MGKPAGSRLPRAPARRARPRSNARCACAHACLSNRAPAPLRTSAHRPNSRSINTNRGFRKRARRLLPDRNTVDIKDKFRNLVKKGVITNDE